MKKSIKLLAIILIVTMLVPFTVVRATNLTKVDKVLEKISSSDIFKESNLTAKYENDAINIEYTFSNPIERVISFSIEDNVIKYESGEITNYDEAKAVVNHSDYFKEFIMYTALKLNGYTVEQINEFFESESNNLSYELNGIEIREIGGDKTFTSENDNEGDITTTAMSMKIDLKKANLKTSSSDEKDITGTTVEDVIEALESDSIFLNDNRITFYDNSLQIIHTDYTNEKNKLSLPCKDGILTYESGDVTNYDEASDLIQHEIFALMITEYALAENGYTQDQIKEFFQSENSDFNYEKNGIEILEIGGNKTFTKDDQTITVAAFSIKVDLERANLEEENFEERNKEYKVLEGANQTYKIGKDTNLTFKFDIDYDYFKTYGDVWLDEKRVEEDNFTSKSGSTVITFNDEFTNTLSEGKHHLEIALAQGRLGIAKTDFTIEKVKTPSENKTEEPTEPAEPTEPTESAKPTEPTESAKPTEPTENAQNSQKSESGTISNPKTGDNIVICISLIVVSMIGIAGTIIFVKKNK